MSVDDVRFCPWEGQILPIDHACIGSTGPCPTEHGDTCGTCPSCLARQEADLMRHGRPSDLDVPNETERP